MFQKQKSETLVPGTDVSLGIGSGEVIVMANWVMVVDDEEMNIMMAGKLLSDKGMRVTALKSGRAMLEYIKNHGTPDVILLDIKMPEMDGFETLSVLRKYENELGLPETPVVFLTSDNNVDTEIRGFREGVADYISKPFVPEVFLARVNNIITMQTSLVHLKKEATIDKLTGLLNEEASNVEFTQMCTSKKGCLMVLDIDNFQKVNEVYGEETGDKVLVKFAGILRETFPLGSRYGRIGGDKFVVFGRNMSTKDEVKNISQKINEEIVNQTKDILTKEEIQLGVSIGAIMVPKLGNDYQSLLKLANKSLRHVKKSNKHGCSIYSTQTMYEADKDKITPDMKEITELVGENNIENVAMQLDIESFSFAYRFATRYFSRNKNNFCKVLFTLEKTDKISEKAYRDYTDDFGFNLRESLRKSDIVTRSRFNQYFVLLTDIKEEYVNGLIEQLLNKWDEKYNFSLNIKYEVEYVRNDGSIDVHKVGANIVMIDDDDASIKVAEKVLKENGFSMTIYRTGSEFLNYVQTMDVVPDMILLDINLPGISGFDVMQKIQSMDSLISQVPIMLITSANNSEMEVKGLKLGAVDYISKPIKPEILKARVDHIIQMILLKNKYDK